MIALKGNMQIVRYTKENIDSCIKIFQSNVGKYFAEWEFAEFETFLNFQASKVPYFVGSDNDEIVACGGFEKHENSVTLIWGMVERSRHGEALGKMLLMYRLNRIFNELGKISVQIDTSQYTQGFYEKYGFIPTKVEKNGYKEGLDKVYMKFNWNELTMPFSPTRFARG